MADSLAGTGTLLRLALRRDRFSLPATVLVFAAIAGASAATAGELYADAAERVQAALLINATAALVAMYGFIYDPTSLGAITLFKLTAWGAAMVSVAAILFVVRHTRAEEEAGRLELLGSGAVGRHAPLAAGLLVGAIFSGGIGVATAATLALAGLPVEGSIVFGVGWALTGAVFAAIAGIAAQITTSARAATGLSLIVLLVTYVLRAAGDLAESPPSPAAWMSPIGWNQQLRAFAGEQWWVVVLPMSALAIATATAFALRSIRDLGSGLLADRPGPAVGRMHSAAALARRLQIPVFLAWATGFAFMGVLLGSIADSITELLDSPAMAEIITALGGEQALSDAFLAVEISLTGMVAAAYAITAVQRLRAEELAGHAEAMLAGAVPRARWLTGHVVLALLGAAALMIVLGVTMGAAYAFAADDPEQIGRVVVATTVRIPGAWLFAGIVVLLFGWAPRWTGAAWALLVGAIVLTEFGALWSLPKALINASPFTHMPMLPGPDPQYGGLGWLALLTAVLLAAGYTGWRRRDLAP